MTSTISSEQIPTIAASPWRRIAAYFVDYCLFIVPLLGVLGLVGWALLSLGISLIPSNGWLGHGIMIVVLTSPVVLYFALSESSRRQATLGKRLLKVVVVDTSGGRATLRQTAIRAVVKLLPWEFFHMIYWHWEGWPTNPAPPSTLQIIALTIGWIVIGWYIVSLFVGPRRTPYDRAAGTAVVSKQRTPARMKV